MKYIEILKKNKILQKKIKGKKKNIRIISNITLNQINEICEYYLISNNIKSKCLNGDFDNILQNTKKYYLSDAIVIFWEISNLFDGFETKNLIYSKNKLYDLEIDIKKQIDLVFKNVKKSRLVIFNKFSINHFYNKLYFNTELEKLIIKLNNYLEKHKKENIYFINLDKIISQLSVNKSLDLVKYYSIKSLYSIEFLQSYIKQIGPIILSSFGNIKKVLVFDFDKTLWPGIIGEDLDEKNYLNDFDFQSKIFNAVYNIIKYFHNNGIILCLCSKNNYSDVIDFFNKDKIKDSLKLEYFVSKKINWKNKHENLIEISQELNLNLDSFVFIDDSDFEINLINLKLPQVLTIKVPDNLELYPQILLDIIPYFTNIAKTPEDKKRNKYYKQQIARNASKNEFQNIKDYLKSLKIAVTKYLDNKKLVDRVAQLSQRTNQFSLTSKRYTKNEIYRFIISKKAIVFAISVNDKFGDFGVTGIAICKINGNNTAIIDTFALSCRILGRDIEKFFINIILIELKKKKIKTVFADYLKTKKNIQVVNFYDECGFKLNEQNKNEKKYSIELKSFRINKINYIKSN